jgi:long-subunit acyl-CoA synthetase (AMP-forming)
MNVLLQNLWTALTAAPGEAELSDGQQSLPLRQLPARVETLRDALAGDGPCLASRLDNGVDALLVELGAQAAGLVSVAIPPYFSPAQMRHMLNDCGAQMLLLPAAAPAPETDWQADAVSPLPGLRLWRRAAVAAAAAIPAGTSCITYTSGSTGLPKGVCLDAATLLSVAQSLADSFAPLAPTRHLCALPLSTLLETVGVFAALLAGASVCLPSLAELGYSGASGLDPRRLRTVLERVQPHSLILVPQLLEGLLWAVQVEGPLGQPPRLIAVGGARVAPALLQRAQASGLPVYEGYGLSEAGSVVCLNPPGAARAGAVGRPLPHLRIELSAEGEVLVHGPRFLGYLGAPTPPAGPLATGDLGWLDADGYLHIEGRKRDVFITAYGRNVSPEWLESELLAQPEIAQCVVCGESRASNLALLLPTDPTLSEAALAAVIARVNAGLPDYARIGGVLRLQTPFSLESGLLTGNGRIRRAAILSHYAEAIDAHYARSATPSLSALTPSSLETV